jgi:hypothetical protein
MYIPEELFCPSGLSLSERIADSVFDSAARGGGFSSSEDDDEDDEDDEVSRSYHLTVHCN